MAGISTSQDNLLIEKSRHPRIINSITQILQLYCHHVDKIIQWYVQINSVRYQSVVHMTMYLVLHLFETGKQDGDILLVNSDIEHPMSS